ncbi:hypothetical protein BJ912DRAFT_964466 [Pholiota molesta]|nr:hypothetical protein BJ912DRAFT_964466 [Pholiota molesta]
MDSRLGGDNGLEDVEASAAAKGSLSPMPAIPGLAVMGMGVSTPATQQMNSWVGSVGKKWGEIKGSPAFTKNQKRASVLLSDIQQTFVSSLISPNSTPDSAASFSNSSYPTPTTPSSHPSLSSNASHPHTPATRSSKTSVSPNASSTLAQHPAQRGVSLIDDSDDFGESGQDNNKAMRLPLAARMMSTSVMVPDSVSRVQEVSKTARADTKEADDDEWNW